MKIKNVTDPEFRRYGRIVDGYDFTEMIKVMEQTPLPEEVIYVPSDNKLEKTEPAIDLKMRIFGELRIQIGYCNGHNSKLNALEYHQKFRSECCSYRYHFTSSIEQDIASDFTYKTSKVEAFLVPAGTGIEIYGTTLHYAPCGVDGNGFKAIVVLPQGTNTDLMTCHTKSYDDKLLTAKNKWLIAHEEAGRRASCKTDESPCLGGKDHE